ncbi:MAG: hypothetical protein R2877_04330 [Bdellovibrionota bacterium]
MKTHLTHFQNCLKRSTAVSGTGINRPKGFPKEVIAEISKRMDLDLKESPNHFAAQAAKDTVVEASSAPESPCRCFIENRQRHSIAGFVPRCGIENFNCRNDNQVLPSCQAKSIQ